MCPPGAALDDTPQAFLEEFRSAILKKRAGQIALAMILALAVWRLVYTIVYSLIVPVLVTVLFRHSESVLFDSRAYPIGYVQIFGGILEFLSMIIVVFYLNRWIHKRPQAVELENPAMFSTVGDTLGHQPAQSADTAK